MSLRMSGWCISMIWDVNMWNCNRVDYFVETAIYRTQDEYANHCTTDAGDYQRITVHSFCIIRQLT